MEEVRSVEVTGKTVDEAIEKALEELEANRDQVAIEVLAEGSRGLLGLGGAEARVRVAVCEQEQQPEALTATEEDVAEIALETLRGLLHHMRVEAEVTLQKPSDESQPIFLDVEGDNLGILIGRQGETLRDLQYVTRLIVSRKLQRRASIVVDVEGYKRRRQRTLTELAERMAKRVVTEGRPVTLEPMPPHERRIVHMALRDHESVRTESTGEGNRRKVVILPRESL
jgi:spoIIIJ-associated protein